MNQTHTDDILVEIRNHVAILTLNRPQALNALSLSMLRTMRSLFDSWAHDDSIHAVITKGAGEKAYCAGGDVRGLHGSVTGTGARVHEDFFQTEYTLNYQLHRFLKNTGKPYIAMMDGIVMGGGMGVAQGATLRIVGDRTKMAMPETKIGLFPDVGGTYFLSRAKDSLGLYLGITSNVINGADALHAKLADLYMSAAAQQHFLDALFNVKWSCSPLGDVVSLANQFATPVADVPRSSLAAVDAAISRHFANKPDVTAIINSLKGETDATLKVWATQIADDISRRSPTLLEVTKRQIESGHLLSLADCLRREYNMMMQVFTHPDVVEGIRALAIDKDNNPQWQPAHLNEVTTEMVDAFFAPRWPTQEHPLSTLETQFG
jgi:enoyl-CoA hydratase/carnithine racemase